MQIGVRPLRCLPPCLGASFIKKRGARADFLGLASDRPATHFDRCRNSEHGTTAEATLFSPSGQVGGNTAINQGEAIMRAVTALAICAVVTVGTASHAQEVDWKKVDEAMGRKLMRRWEEARQ